MHPSHEGFSGSLKVFHGRILPEPARPAGYAWLWDRFRLRAPLPPRLAGIGIAHRKVTTDDWFLLTPRHAPADTVEGHLVFALKWEGVELGLLGALFRILDPAVVEGIVRTTPTGIYARRLWFLCEWLTGRQLELADAPAVTAVPVLDPRHHVAPTGGSLSARHRVIDNLPGDSGFCPLVRRTEAIDAFAALDLGARTREAIGSTPADVVSRAAAFLLLSDSRASFALEGESPPADRTARWGRAIAEAGRRDLSVEELVRLQRIVIGDARFVELGLRTEGGFVGEHDRATGLPLPEHVNARPDDLETLVGGLVRYADRALQGGMDPVAVAAVVAFGFVYIHPFTDGNGRIHRWLLHHLLARGGVAPPGLIFPVSAAILRNVATYRAVLAERSAAILPLIEWRPTERGNVEVLNDTADLYRYFDATRHVEFIYAQVQETVERDLPEGVAYLEALDRFRAGVEARVDMPARTLDLLHDFLRQGAGRLSRRARTREFAALHPDEVDYVEALYSRCFGAATPDDS